MTLNTPHASPIVIVGAGPVGVRMAVELVQAGTTMPVVVYGDEPWQPYNRVRLSALLAGEDDWADFTEGLSLPVTVERRFGCRVTAIDPAFRTLHDETGATQAWSKLILATGSRPHVPDIPGVGLKGVFTFRGLADAEALQARLASSRRIAVVGGGLLGLETARALKRYRTDLVVVEHHPRLMPNQLDDAASARLCAHVEASGIEVVLDDGPMAILGERRVEGLRLRSGAVLACDSVVFAAGIRPNIDLARDAGLAFQRGILVDDRLHTSAPRIGGLNAIFWRSWGGQVRHSIPMSRPSGSTVVRCEPANPTAVVHHRDRLRVHPEDQAGSPRS